MLSSTMTTLSGSPRRSSAVTRGMEVGSRPQLFSRRARYASFSCARVSASVALRRCAASLNSAPACAHRIRQRGKAASDVADHAGIEPVIECETLGRCFDLHDDRAFGKWPPGANQMSSKNGPPSNSTRSASPSALRTCRGIAGQ